ncbi:unnamed protein product [Microthlaspi erraticum]|uniref:Uncharacterized protein n=1 Tax=Microthlaspi erraticum TaxID=1685480 RepID=A0A6D2KS86_9BRAS|nr:unnamed protein product [Microthlaspi erraticum]
MKFCYFPSNEKTPTRSMIRLLVFGCSTSPMSPMSVWKRSGELLRTSSSRSSLIPEPPPGCKPNPPPEPPDPPDLWPVVSSLVHLQALSNPPPPTSLCALPLPYPKHKSIEFVLVLTFSGMELEVAGCHVCFKFQFSGDNPPPTDRSSLTISGFPVTTQRTVSSPLSALDGDKTSSAVVSLFHSGETPPRSNSAFSPHSCLSGGCPQHPFTAVLPWAKFVHFSDVLPGVELQHCNLRAPLISRSSFTVFLRLCSGRHVIMQFNVSSTGPSAGFSSVLTDLGSGILLIRRISKLFFAVLEYYQLTGVSLNSLLSFMEIDSKRSTRAIRLVRLLSTAKELEIVFKTIIGALLKKLPVFIFDQNCITYPFIALYFISASSCFYSLAKGSQLSTLVIAI